MDKGKLNEEALQGLFSPNLFAVSCNYVLLHRTALRLTVNTLLGFTACSRTFSQHAAMPRLCKLQGTTLRRERERESSPPAARSPTTMDVKLLALMALMAVATHVPTSSAKPISLVERCWCRSTLNTVPQRSIKELKFLHTPNCPFQVIHEIFEALLLEFMWEMK
ncbi:Stromal cell-derived factor 1 [Liparis tanakae]|uniref:Stromal cell-derived factor 1 n=1 Tax=Liparis tanakae TaxID=230148 RepID=A0A4Z2GY06_9TELE|nr:Stromal cell-derived factor 1 [Liparis tanakae]